MKLNKTGSPLTRQERHELNKNWEEIEKNFNNVVDKVAQEAFDRVIDGSKVDWSQMVETFEDLPADAEEGEARGVSADSKLYRFDGTEWVPIAAINLNPISEVENRLNTKIDESVESVSAEIEETNIELAKKALQGDLNTTNASVNNIYNELNKNLFNGVYFDGMLFGSNPPDGEYKLVPVFNYSDYEGKVAIIPIEHGKTYTIKVHDPELQNHFRIGASTDYPTFQENEGDLGGQQPVPPGYYTLDVTLLAPISSTPQEHTFTNDDNMNYLSIYVNNRGEEPRLQVEEGSQATNFVPRVNISREPTSESGFDDEAAKSAFIEEMNRYAERIGMTNSYFVEPAGFPSTDEQQMSTKDLLLLGIQASGYKEMARSWNKRDYRLLIGGTNARSRTITSTIKTNLLSDYFVFGGKTGGISSDPELRGNHLFVVTDAPNDNMFVAALRQADTDSQRYEDMSTALDNAKALMENPDATVNDIDSDSAAVCLMPKFNHFNYEQYDIPIIYGKDVNTPGHPASLSKIMSTVIMLDYVKDLKRHITIKEIDITPGTGNYFVPGDVITFEDALYSMMLPSSNTATHAVAREVGYMIMSH